MLSVSFVLASRHLSVVKDIYVMSTPVCILFIISTHLSFSLHSVLSPIIVDYQNLFCFNKNTSI